MGVTSAIEIGPSEGDKDLIAHVLAVEEEWAAVGNREFIGVKVDAVEQEGRQLAKLAQGDGVGPDAIEGSARGASVLPRFGWEQTESPRPQTLAERQKPKYSPQ